MDRQTLEYANNKFNCNLFKVLLKESNEKNIFVSPLSIQVALAMTYLGAHERTAEEMEVVLGWDQFDDKTVHEQFQEYFAKLQKSQKDYKLSLVNRIYIEKTFDVQGHFSQDTKQFYFAEPVLANFKEESKEERVKINTWVAQQTEDKIKDLLVSGILNADSRMVLINAVYFKGKWSCPFLARETYMHPFKVAPDTTIKVPTMTAVHVYGFTKDSELQCSAIEILYKGDELSLVIILPDDDFGLETLVQKLDGEGLHRLLTNVRLERDTFLLSLPKFEITSSFALKHPLSDMGMPEAFSQSANFSGISCDKKGLRLSDVIHKSYLKVDEKGTEAATATAAIMIPECDIQCTPFTINHPFLFAIIDRRHKNLLIFWGQITDPSIKT